MPKPDERNFYPRSYTFENGILELGMFEPPAGRYFGDPPNIGRWVWEHVLGNPNGTRPKRDQAAVDAANAAPDVPPPPELTPDQKRRAAKLLTHLDNSGPSQCIAKGHICLPDHGPKCCSGVCGDVGRSSSHNGTCR